MNWLKLAPYIAFVLVLVGLGVWHTAKVHAADQAGYVRAQTEARAELDRMRIHYEEIGNEVQREHQQDVEKLRADADRELRRRPIRCVLGTAPEVRADQNTGQPAGGPGGESALRAAPDIRPQLVYRGSTCEDLRSKLIAIKKLQAR